MKTIRAILRDQVAETVNIVFVYWSIEKSHFGSFMKIAYLPTAFLRFLRGFQTLLMVWHFSKILVFQLEQILGETWH